MTEWMLDKFQERIEQACPLGRIGRPEDMAGIAMFLASRAGAYLNGTIIPVDGGLSAV
jgi:NAD(P)-dependent dehydrogenase (short-subunit alcohol dehydrogenase family)